MTSAVEIGSERATCSNVAKVLLEALQHSLLNDLRATKRKVDEATRMLDEALGR